MTERYQNSVSTSMMTSAAYYWQEYLDGSQHEFLGDRIEKLIEDELDKEHADKMNKPWIVSGYGKVYDTSLRLAPIQGPVESERGLFRGTQVVRFDTPEGERWKVTFMFENKVSPEQTRYFFLEPQMLQLEPLSTVASEDESRVFWEIVAGNF